MRDDCVKRARCGKAMSSFVPLRIGSAIATLLVGVVAAAPACAVTLYGRVDLNLTRLQGAGWDMRQASNSRIGLRGAQDLGDGLGAVFQLEARINADTGTTDAQHFWGRESWVGLQGPFGVARLGRSQSPAQRMASLHDPHGTDGIGSFGSSGLLLGHSATRFGRMGNAIHYDSPRVGGFSASAAWAVEPSAGPGSPRHRSIRLRYQRGPVDVSLGRGDLARGNHVNSLVASWDLARIKPMLQMHSGQRDARRRAAWLVGATAPLPQGEMRLSFSKQDDRGSGPQTDRSLLAVGLNHGLSKRSTVYATAVRDRIGGQRARTGFEVGLRHAF